jgi:hypothetical protein
MDGQRHAPAGLPQERLGTHCIGGWVGPGSVWKGAESLTPHRDSIPGLSSPWRVAIPTELSRSYVRGHTECLSS